MAGDRTWITQFSNFGGMRCGLVVFCGVFLLFSPFYRFFCMCLDYLLRCCCLLAQSKLLFIMCMIFG